MRSLDIEEGQVCPRPLLLASSEQGLLAVLVSPTMCAACWRKLGMVLKHHCGGEEELPVAGLEVVFLVHSDLLLGV